MTQTPFSLTEYGRRIEKALRAQGEIAAVLAHAGERGQAREAFARSFLRSFLPAAVVVGTGLVVDSKGTYSRQQDIVLYRHNFPVFTTLAGASMFLAEGVLAVAEVRSKLTAKTAYDTAWRNSASIKALSTDALSGMTLEQPSGAHLPDPDVIAGLNTGALKLGDLTGRGDPLLSVQEKIYTYWFAYDCASAKSLRERIAATEQPDGEGPDCVCVLGKMWAHGPENGVFQSSHPTGYTVEDCQYPMGNLLAHMAIVVSARRPRVPPMRAYLRGDFS